MTLLLTLAVTAARGHGGEDHGAPPPPIAVAVVRFDDPLPGRPAEAKLLLADFGTSAPVAAGTATLELHGPSTVRVEVAAGKVPGVWPFSVTFPAPGDWGGGLTVLTPDRADVLGLPTFPIGAAAPSSVGSAWPPAPVVGFAALAAVAFAVAAFFAGRWSRGAVAVAIAVLGLGLGRRSAAEGPGGLHLPLDSQFLLELRTARVAERPFAETVRALGTTVPRPGGAAEIHAPVTGIVHFPRTLVPGETVRAGDVLATLQETLGGADRSSFVEARGASRVALAEARKKLAVAERDLDRSASLGDVLSERERLERSRTVEVAREEVRQAEIATQAMAEAGPTTTLRSPLNGRISALLANPGDVVAPADVLFRVTDAGGLWVEAAVPETWAGRLVVGGGAVLVSDAHRDQPVAATVLDPGLEADPASGMLRVVLAAAEPVDWLVPGMSVTAAIQVGAPRSTLVVPDSAVVDAGGETLVFVKTAPERFEVRPVRVGALAGDDREVSLGLEPGERVVVQGTYALRSLAGR